MNIDILKKKPKILVNGEYYLDLSYNVFSSDSIFDFIMGIEIVSEKQVMRPDLISLKWYGDTKNLGMLLKCNNIFNPYSIQEDDIIIIPAIKQDTKIYKSPGQINKSELRQTFTDKARMTENDITKLKAAVNANKALKNKLKTPLPPNMLQEGVTNKKFENGQIILTNHHGVK